MGTTLGRRAYTTIDRSKPTAALQLAGGAAFVSNTNVALKVDFADDVAGPFPANFLCFQVGGTSGVCDTSKGAIYGYNASCSVPGGGGKSTTFTCTADYGNIADGDVWACVIAADASIPDNPNGPNQTATADKANLSTASCDSVVVDRTPPVAAINTAATTVKVGDLLTFQGSATDATSGLTGPGEWTFGDTDAIPSGDIVTHVYDQPGTYEVTLHRPGRRGQLDDGAQDDHRARHHPAARRRRPGRRRPDRSRSRSTGSASTLRTRRAPGPSSFPSSSPRPTAARSSSSCSTATKVLARATVRLDPDGTADHRLKLKKGTAPGRYVLKATWKPPRSAADHQAAQPPAGQEPARGGAPRRARAPVRSWAPGRARCPTAPSTVRRRASASASHGVEVGIGPRALPDGAFHGTRPARTFKVR